MKRLQLSLEKFCVALSTLICLAMLSACNIFPNPKDSELDNKKEKGEKIEVVHDAPKAGDVQVFLAKKNGENLELVPVSRPIHGDKKLNAVIEELLRGPTPEEEKAGLISEIPKGTILLGIKEKDQEVEIDLSKRFSTGSVSSMQTRLDQLTKTVSPLGEGQKIYLDVEGKRLEASSFDGLEIKQPIN